MMTGLIGLTAMGIQGMQRGRASTIVELRGVLDTARMTAISEGREVYVAFLNGSAPKVEDRYRKVALFAPSSDEADIFRRPVEALQNWTVIGDGLLLGYGEEYVVREGEAPLKTIMNSPLVRTFPVVPAVEEVELPFLMFDRRGRLVIPPIYLEDHHHVGVVEAAYEEGYEDPNTTRRVAGRQYLGLQVVPDLSERAPRSELLRISPHDGRSIPLTR
ncbi:MAG: hypothetical protein AAGJ31_06540 [Verrucomicrobiota bacterium]